MTLYMSTPRSTAIDETPFVDVDYLHELRLSTAIGTPSLRATHPFEYIRRDRGTPSIHESRPRTGSLDFLVQPKFVVTTLADPVRKSARGIDVSQRALRAVADLAGWLDLSEVEAAALAGVNRRTLNNWRSKKGAYGASSRYLFSVHTLVSQLVAKVGIEPARLWLHTASDAGVSRLEQLRQGLEGLADVLRAAEPLIFALQVRPTRSEGDEGDPEWGTERADAALMASSPRRHDLFNGPARRVRRV